MQCWQCYTSMFWRLGQIYDIQDSKYLSIQCPCQSTVAVLVYPYQYAQCMVSTHNNLVESPSGGKLRVSLPRTQVVLQRTHLFRHHIDTAGELEKGGGRLEFQLRSEELGMTGVPLTSTPSMYLMMFGCRSVFSLRWADCANLICEVGLHYFADYYCNSLFFHLVKFR